MQVKVPDIGDFDEVPVIEMLVAVGDEVAVEDPLVVLESDKATMEVPSPAAGTVTDITVAVGDKVAEGSVLLTLEGAPEAKPATDAPAEQARAERRRRRPRPARPLTPTSACRWPCWAVARAATRRRSVPPTSASAWR